MTERTATAVPERDRGAALLLALFALLLGSTVVAATVTYAMAVSRNNHVREEKTDQVQAAKAGLRVALANPIALYNQCATAGMTVGVTLADPGLATTTRTTCFKLSEARADRPGNSRFAVAAVQVGATAPTSVLGTPYPGSGASPANAWRADASTTATDGKIWLPNLPSRVTYRRSSNGYQMPSGFPQCNVFFPGTYTSTVTITGSRPVYFTSGIYYFEKQVRISGNAQVVVGGGSVPGCTTDQQAAFYATNAPAVHGISGLGATFVFGSEGRLVVDTNNSGTLTSVIFNERHVNPSDLSSAASQGVSIMSVNGASGGSLLGLSDLLATTLSVPLSQVGLTNPVPATDQGYLPSTLVPSLPALSSDRPIVDLTMSGSRQVTVQIPGAISVPQGMVRIQVSNAAAAANKDVRLTGGVVAAQISVSPVPPATLNIGLVAPIVQRTFKLTSVSPGSPSAVANAIVQVNQTGAFAVNSWEVR